MSIKNFFKKILGSESAQPSASSEEKQTQSQEQYQSVPEPEKTILSAPSSQSAPRAIINPMPVPSEPKRVTREVGAEPKVDLNKNINRKVVSLAKFQFQNLVSKPILFAFFDLRSAESVPRFAKAVTIEPDQVVGKIKATCPSKDFPILIICEDGTISASLANEVFNLGYINVYTLDGGTKRLQ